MSVPTDPDDNDTMCQPPICDVEPDRRERRRRAMIDAAFTLFLKNGYDAVTLADIVRTSGGSLATLYALFDGKAGLLAAIVNDQRVIKMDDIGNVTSAGLPPRESLMAIAHILHRSFKNPETVSMMRIVMGESLRNPEFARTIFETVHLAAFRAVCELIDQWKAAGIGEIDDPALAARMFLGLVLYDNQMRHLLCGKAISPEEDQEAIEAAVALFVSGYKLDG